MQQLRSLADGLEQNNVAAFQVVCPRLSRRTKEAGVWNGQAGGALPSRQTPSRQACIPLRTSNTPIRLCRPNSRVRPSSQSPPPIAHTPPPPTLLLPRSPSPFLPVGTSSLPSGVSRKAVAGGRRVCKGGQGAVKDDVRGEGRGWEEREEEQALLVGIPS